MVVEPDVPSPEIIIAAVVPEGDVTITVPGSVKSIPILALAVPEVLSPKPKLPPDKNISLPPVLPPETIRRYCNEISL